MRVEVNWGILTPARVEMSPAFFFCFFILFRQSINSGGKCTHALEFKDEDCEETVESTVEEIRASGKGSLAKIRRVDCWRCSDALL